MVGTAATFTLAGQTWPAEPAAIRRAASAPDDLPWLLAGTRIQADGGTAGGLRSVWSGARCLLHEVVLEIGGAPAVGAGGTVSSSDAERTLRTAAHDGRERWAAAVDLPVFWWEIDASPAAEVRLTCSILPGETGSADPSVELGEAGRFVLVRAHAPPHRVVLLLDGLTGSVDRARSGAGAQLVLRGTGRTQLLVLAAGDDADLERTLATLARKGLAGLQRQRAQHARLLREYGTRIENGDAGTDDAFEWAKIVADGEVNRVAGADADAPAGLAAAMLAAGLREPARRLLQAATPAGGPADAIRRLAVAWARWTGDQACCGLGNPPAEPGRVPGAGPARELSGVVERRWGVVADASRHEVAVLPTAPADRAREALRRLRIGATVLDLELRRRGLRVTLSVVRVAGPPVTVTAGLPVALAGVTLDDEPLGGGRARFEASGRHEVGFELARADAGAAPIPERYSTGRSPAASTDCELPLASTQFPVTAEPQDATARLRETVLLVDDEPGVLRATGRLLEHLGYRVVTAADGVNAVAGLESEPVRLVITDMVMPHMDGRELIGVLRRRWPDMPVVLSTGYDAGRVSRDTLRLFDAVLPKPYSAEELAAAIATSIERRRGGRP